jgi:uncharacterized membrane protein YeaQ/YmgE (transglycosylase-associated protein family)
MKEQGMGILVFIVFGLLVGLVARAIMPGRQSMGLGMTALLGVVGSFIGGLVGNLIGGRDMFDLNAAGFIGSLLGALALLLVLGSVGRRRLA